MKTNRRQPRYTELPVWVVIGFPTAVVIAITAFWLIAVLGV